MERVEHEPLPLPVELRKLIVKGRWLRDEHDVNAQSFVKLVPEDRVRRIASDEREIHFYCPPFRTVREGLAGNYGFWLIDGAANDLVPELCLDVGDFGHGSDSPIILRYSDPASEPSVMRLEWVKGGPNRWVEIASSFGELVVLLDLKNANWTGVRGKGDDYRRSAQGQHLDLEQGSEPTCLEGDPSLLSRLSRWVSRLSSLFR